MTRAASGFCLLVVLAIALQGARAEDPDVEVLKRGEDALHAGEWSSAEEAYREALETSPRSLPARRGLAEALIGAGKEKEGVAELRRAVRWAEAVAELPEGWMPVLLEARERLRALDKVSDRLEKLLDYGTKDLLKFAKSRRRKSPDDAAFACYLAARLDPGSTDMEPPLADLGAPPPGRWIPVYQGTPEGWPGVAPPIWTCKDGGILACESGESSFACHNDRRMAGDFDMRVEYRVVETLSPEYCVALSARRTAPFDAMEWGITRKKVFLVDHRSEDVDLYPRYIQPLDNQDPPVDETAFNLFELRFRGDRIEAWLNGVHLLTTDRGRHCWEGYLGLRCMHATAEFRRMEIRQR